MTGREPIWCDDHHRVEEIDDDYDDVDYHGNEVRVAITTSGCRFTARRPPARTYPDEGMWVA